MASVITSHTPAYIPTPEQIAAACDEIHLQRLADFDAGIIPRDGFHQKRKGKEAKAAANLVLQQSDESEPLDLAPKTICGKVPVPEGGPREMTREDICNVEFVRASDFDSVFDSLIESVSFQHALEDCECRWNIADVAPELMELSDVVPFKSSTSWPESHRKQVGSQSKHAGHYRGVGRRFAK